MISLLSKLNIFVELLCLKCKVDGSFYRQVEWSCSSENTKSSFSAHQKNRDLVGQFSLLSVWNLKLYQKDEIFLFE
jgi:hypothetical protein